MNKRNAAVFSWLSSVELSRVIRPIGHVPGDRMVMIAAILVRLDPGR